MNYQLAGENIRTTTAAAAEEKMVDTVWHNISTTLVIPVHKMNKARQQDEQSTTTTFSHIDTYNNTAYRHAYIHVMHVAHVTYLPR